MSGMNNRAQSGTKILALALAVTVSLVVLAPVVTSIDNSTGTQSVDNESFTADFGNFSDVSGYNIDSSTVEVYDDSGQVSSDNFTVEEGSGEIQLFSNASNDGVTDGETVEATYEYQATEGVTTTVIGFVPVMLVVLVIVALSRKITEMM